jgi:hypothetical protein
VFYLGQGLLEVSGHAAGPPGRSVMIWIQVRDVHAEHARLAAAGVAIAREPIAEPWGLIEMWIEDPDGVRIVLVEVPADHPLRRDPRPALPPGRRSACRIPARSRKRGSPAPARNADVRAFQSDHLPGRGHAANGGPHGGDWYRFLASVLLCSGRVYGTSERLDGGVCRSAASHDRYDLPRWIAWQAA